jgi:hypothetical protein
MSNLLPPEESEYLQTKSLPSLLRSIRNLLLAVGIIPDLPLTEFHFEQSLDLDTRMLDDIGFTRLPNGELETTPEYGRVLCDVEPGPLH